MTSRASSETKEKIFMQHYGSNAASLAYQWYDLCVVEDPSIRLDIEEISVDGFRKFMMAHNFLWDTPKNSQVFATRWKQWERLSRGIHIWKWISKIAALKPVKIVWDPRLDDEDTETFIVTIDAVDFRMAEKSTELLRVDRKQYSQKFNHGALKYEIAISVFDGKPVWTSNGTRAGRNDNDLLQAGGLLDKIKPGKLGITDGGYGHEKLSVPNPREPKEVRRFKSRARCRHETFNGRLKHFNALCQTFTYPPDKHQMVFEAVCVTVVYQIENGSPLFVVA